MKQCILLSVVVLAGCYDGPPRVQYSETLHEGGKVVETMHSQGHHESNIAVGFGRHPTFTPVTVDIPESWGVVFRCEYGNKFVIQGSEQKHRALWDRLDTGQEVTIYYKEIYDVEYEKRLGEWVEASRTLRDYDFIDAWPKDSENE